MKLKLIAIIVASILGLGAVVGIGVGIYLNQPEVVVGRAVYGVFTDMQKREELEPVFKTLQKGSIATTIKDPEGNLIGMSINGKVYFNKDALYAEGIKIKTNDGLTIGGNAYISLDQIYIDETELIDKSVGASTGSFGSLLDGSIFDPESNTKYSLDEYTYDIVKSSLQVLDSEDEDFSKDLEKLIERYIKESYDIFCEHATFESKTEKVDLGTGTKSCRVITVTITSSALENMVADFCEYAREDKKLEKFLEEHEDKILPIFKEIGYDDDDLVSLVNDFIDLFEDACSDLDFEDVDITIATPKLSSTLLMLAVEYDGDELLRLDLGNKGIKDSEVMSLTMHENDSYIFTVEENNSKKYSAILTNKYSYKDYYTGKNKTSSYDIFEFSYDKKDETFVLEIDDSDIEIEGTIEKKGKIYTITSTDVGDWDKFSFSITINQSDKMPEPSASFKKASVLTVEDVDKLRRFFDKIF